MSPDMTREQLVTAFCRETAGHVSVSRGALPFIVPVELSCTPERIDVLSDHPTIVHGASRGDIAAIQVEAHIDGTDWSITATGPLSTVDEATDKQGAVVHTASALVAGERLKSGHGQRFDPLLRSGLASST